MFKLYYNDKNVSINGLKLKQFNKVTFHYQINHMELQLSINLTIKLMKFKGPY